jgi:hypothetical protein
LLLTVHFVRVVFLSFQFRTGFCNIITGQCATQHILFILFLPRPIDKCRNCGVVGEEAKIKKKKKKKRRKRLEIFCVGHAACTSVCVRKHCRPLATMRPPSSVKLSAMIISWLDIVP